MVVDFTNFFVVLFIIGTVFSVGLNLLLEHIDYNFRKKHGKKIPSELSEHITTDILTKTGEYDNARYALWIPRMLVTTSLSVVLLLFGFYPHVFNTIWNMTAGVAGDIAHKKQRNLLRMETCI